MKYKDIRKLINTGDILSCAGPWKLSRLIRYLSHQPVSHVGIACWVRFGGEKRLCIFEAIEGIGVRLQPLQQYLEHIFWTTPKAKMWWQPIIDPTINGEKVMDFALQHWGDNYVNPYQFAVCLNPWIRRWLGKSLDLSNDRWHCAELVTRALMEQGFIHGEEPVMTSPGDVTQFNCLGPKILIEKD